MSSVLAQKFSDAIQDALAKVGTEHGGSMNAALGALVAAQAYLIAGIPDRNHRRMLIAECAKVLPEQVAAQRQIGETASAQTVVVKGGIN